MLSGFMTSSADRCRCLTSVNNLWGDELSGLRRGTRMRGDKTRSVPSRSFGSHVSRYPVPFLEVGAEAVVERAQDLRECPPALDWHAKSNSNPGRRLREQVKKGSRRKRQERAAGCEMLTQQPL